MFKFQWFITVFSNDFVVVEGPKPWHYDEIVAVERPVAMVQIEQCKVSKLGWCIGTTPDQLLTANSGLGIVHLWETNWKIMAVGSVAAGKAMAFFINCVSCMDDNVDEPYHFWLTQRQWPYHFLWASDGTENSKVALEWWIQIRLYLESRYRYSNEKSYGPGTGIIKKHTLQSRYRYSRHSVQINAGKLTRIQSSGNSASQVYNTSHGWKCLEQR